MTLLQDKIRAKATTIIINIFSIICILVSYISESLFNIIPCALCLYQRYLYIIIALYTLFCLILIKSSKFTYILLITSILLFFQTIIAFYNIGVENKVFTAPKVCQLNEKSYSSLDELSSIIKNNTKHSSCNKPQFIFYNITFAQANFIIASLLLILNTKVIYNEWTNGKI